MKRLLRHELARPFALALILIGVFLIGLAIVRYTQSSYGIGQNYAFQRQSQAGEVALQNESEARVLMAADMELRELISERNSMVIVGGAGLILIALGWLLNDLVRTAGRDHVKSSTA